MFLRDPGTTGTVLRSSGGPADHDRPRRPAHALGAHRGDALLLRSAHVIAFTPEGPVARFRRGSAARARRARAWGRWRGACLPTRPASGFRTDRGLKRLDRELLEKRLHVELMLRCAGAARRWGCCCSARSSPPPSTPPRTSRCSARSAGRWPCRCRLAAAEGPAAVARLEEELSLARRSRDVPAQRLPAAAALRGARREPALAPGGRRLLRRRAVRRRLVLRGHRRRRRPRRAGCAHVLDAAGGPAHPAAHSRNVGEILRNINALIYRSTAVHQFATFFLAHIDPTGCRMSFANAGHNYPVLVRANGERHFLERGGLIWASWKTSPWTRARSRCTTAT